MFTPGVAIVTTDAARGDFLGRTDGPKDVGTAVGVLVIREVVRAPAGAGRLRPALQTAVRLGPASGRGS